MVFKKRDRRSVSPPGSPRRNRRSPQAAPTRQKNPRRKDNAAHVSLPSRCTLSNSESFVPTRRQDRKLRGTLPPEGATALFEIEAPNPTPCAGRPKATKNDQTPTARLSADGRFDRSHVSARWPPAAGRGSAVGVADIGNSDFAVKHFFEIIVTTR
jgi:hypothetical protein